MKLKDFYFEEKAQIGSRMNILLPDGSDSGEWLNIISPEADAAVRAGRAFLFAYQAKASELEHLKGPEEIDEHGRKTYGVEYALALNDACTDLNRQLAAEIINGWSFEEPFSKEAVQELLEQYPALGNMVAGFQADQRRNLDQK